jgi:hypothetical protein
LLEPYVVVLRWLEFNLSPGLQILQLFIPVWLVVSSSSPRNVCMSRFEKGCIEFFGDSVDVTSL